MGIEGLKWLFFLSLDLVCLVSIVDCSMWSVVDSCKDIISSSCLVCLISIVSSCVFGDFCYLVLSFVFVIVIVILTLFVIFSLAAGLL